MKIYEQRGREQSIIFKIDNLTTDAATGTTWSGDAYGQILFTKASSDNAMYEFIATSVTVSIADDGIIDQANNYTVVQSATTGFVGVKGASLQAGSKVAICGYFVKLGSNADAIMNHKFSDSPNIGYGDGGAGNVVGSTINGTTVL
jgi:hypothetical protein